MGKKNDHKKVMKRLDEHQQPVQPDDVLAEAGRKVLLGELIEMLKREAGSRTGNDIEDVHKMRVAIRQSRSAFRLLSDVYKPKVVRTYDKGLRKIMRALGDVRDLDVMIGNLRAFDAPLDDVQAAAMQEVIGALDLRRTVARDQLLRVLDSKAYQRFVKDYSDFLTTPSAGIQSNSSDEIVPVQVRHVLPPMIYEHLAMVRAYEPALEDAEAETLHALRIEFKRLRYVVTLFSGVLGKEIADFIVEVKKIQDILGEMNDIEVAHESLTDLMDDLEGDQIAALWIYLDALENQKPDLYAQFPAAWKRFNAKTVQRKLAVAVAEL